MDPRAQEVLSFWLGELDADGLASEQVSARWWRKDPAFDEEIRQRFGAIHAAIMSGEHRDWLSSARGCLAYVIVLDQFSRNMFRDSAAMFASDALALRTVVDALDAHVDQQLAPAERTMLYMPLMHSEDLTMQERCVERFTALRDESQGRVATAAAGNLKFAIAHRDIVARWGRFPHRNAPLGRTSTPEELTFLQQPGSSF